MVLKKRNPREVISMFLRSTEDFSSFFEAGIFVKEKKCLIKHSYVAIIRYKGYDFSSYKESALFLICMKKSMVFILKIIKIVKNLDVKIEQKNQKNMGFMVEIEADDNEVSLLFSNMSILHEFIRDVRQHKEMLDTEKSYFSNQNHAWLSFYKACLPYDNDMLSVYNDDFFKSLTTSVDDLNIPYFSEKIYSYIHNTNNHIKNLNNNVSDWIDHKLSVHKSFFIESRDLKVKVCSWNVNGKEPVEDISDWLLYKSDDNRVDLYVIGLQEIDLSTEAYLHNDGIKEQVWNYSILSVLGDHYEKVVSKQLVGILLLVYAHKAISPSLTSITTSFVGCGIMGIMGNKGAVAIRLIIWDTVFCFVNSHLAAMRSQVDRRNQNFREICRKMYFHEDKSHKDKTPKSLFDCDHLIWCGDLNYRIDMSVFDVKELSKKREYDLLLEFDQLNIQKRLNHCFENFIEAEINFPPTFKYKTGTSEFDSSEKMRVPSWTDRILWKSKGILVKNYRSYMDNVMSDHKPISAELNAKIEILLVNDYLKLRESLMKEYRCSENKMIPMINLSVNHFNFENVVYFQPKTRVLRIDNIGQVTVEFEFIPKKKDTCICKPWIWPYPCSGLIDPGDCHYINLTVYVDNTTVSTLNSKDDSLDDILILHLKNGGDFFISVEGTFLPTRFGMSLEQLSRLDSSEISNENNSETYLWSIPKEIIRITEYLLSEGKNIDNLFFTPGSTSIMTHIREALDTGNEFDLCILENNGSKDNIGLFSMAQTLLMFLDALPDSIIPSSFYYQCLEASRCKEDSIIILDMIPSLNANLFIYMADFVREVLWDSSLDTFKRTACLFSSILMRSSSFKTEQHLQKQNAFFQWFLSDSHPNLSS